MAVLIAEPLTVTETFNLGSFGDVVLAVDSPRQSDQPC